jgi:hypothetical protein
MVSVDLSETIGDMSRDKKSIIRAIKQREQPVRNIINNYPAFFKERLEDLLHL